MQISSLKPDRNLGILVGLLLTDGYVNPKEGKIVFTNKSEELHKLFRETVSKVFGKVNFLENFNKNGVKNTTVNKKSIVKRLLEFTPTFRTRKFKNGKFPNAQIPRFFNSLSSDDLSKVLQAMFSADGSVILRVRWNKFKKKWEILREIRLASEHPTLKNQIKKLLKKLGFKNPRIRKDCIAICNKHDLIKFAKEIRFVDGVKVTKNKLWSGRNKNEVLDLLVKSFNIRQVELDCFDSKEKIINFLKSLI